MNPNNLISYFNRGDEQALKVIFELHYSLLLYFSMKITGNRESSEDIVLISFQSLFSRCEHFGSMSCIKSFLYKTVRNNSISHLRSQKTINNKINEFAILVENDTYLKYEYSIKEGLLAIVYAEIEKLPYIRRKVFKMVYFEEIEPCEVAIALGISVQTVYSHVHIAKSSLKILKKHIK